MHPFSGVWITNEEFYELSPRNVFHRQLQPLELPCQEHRNRHILFRRVFTLDRACKSAQVFITADDYYKLYINGRFVAQGPTMSYHFQYNYNTVDVTPYLVQGKNTVAVHTFYQGMINRVWQSGDHRHGLILDLVADGQTVLKSDERFRVQQHSGYRELHEVGIRTQCMEEYDSRCPEAGFAQPDFDDSAWGFARRHLRDDHVLKEQETAMLEFEKILPRSVERQGNTVRIDFGSNYVGYLDVTAEGNAGDVLTVRCGQELNGDGSVRYELRCNCRYEETWILADGESTLDWFDYKAFRYAEILLPESARLKTVSLNARHYPFTLKAGLRPEYVGNKKLEAIWELCINTQKYGIQEVIQDCMDREKGFYVGDGCYTALTHYILTGDDSMVRKLIDDGFASGFITEGLVTCLNCSWMQEIAEYPLILISLLLWHYRLSGDLEYLRQNYPKAVALLECYRRDYEHDGLLSELDKWCVVEWPMNYRDGYDVDIREGLVCHQAHVAINAYYLNAIQTVNAMAQLLGNGPYRQLEPMKEAFRNAFYVEEEKLFRDGVETDHISLIGNAFAFAFGLCPNAECEQKILDWIVQRKISSLMFFTTFPVLAAMARKGRQALVTQALLDEDAWLKMLREDATTTFEGWCKDSKWNLSLFHMTFSYAAVFLSDTDLPQLFSL